MQVDVRFRAELARLQLRNDHEIKADHMPFRVFIGTGHGKFHLAFHEVLQGMPGVRHGNRGRLRFHGHVAAPGVQGHRALDGGKEVAAVVFVIGRAGGLVQHGGIVIPGRTRSGSGHGRKRGRHRLFLLFRHGSGGGPVALLQHALHALALQFPGKAVVVVLGFSPGLSASSRRPGSRKRAHTAAHGLHEQRLIGIPGGRLGLPVFHHRPGLARFPGIFSVVAGGKIPRVKHGKRIGRIFAHDNRLNVTSIYTALPALFLRLPPGKAREGEIFRPFSSLRSPARLFCPGAGKRPPAGNAIPGRPSAACPLRKAHLSPRGAQCMKKSSRPGADLPRKTKKRRPLCRRREHTRPCSAPPAGSFYTLAKAEEVTINMGRLFTPSGGTGRMTALSRLPRSAGAQSGRFPPPAKPPFLEEMRR